MNIIEIYADVWCPFAYVGIVATRDERSRRQRLDVALELHAWPLELVNHAPQDAAKTAANVNALREQVAPNLFANFDPSNFPTSTLRALALASASYALDTATGERVSMTLREALFERGEDISSDDVLAAIASEFALSPGCWDDQTAVMSEYSTGRKRGVKGSPHFFFGDRDIFCPSLDITRDDEGHLLLERNMQQLGEFLDHCLGAT